MKHEPLLYGGLPLPTAQTVYQAVCLCGWRYESRDIEMVQEASNQHVKDEELVVEEKLEVKHDTAVTHTFPGGRIKIFCTCGFEFDNSNEFYRHLESFKSGEKADGDSSIGEQQHITTILLNNDRTFSASCSCGWNAGGFSYKTQSVMEEATEQHRANPSRAVVDYPSVVKKHQDIIQELQTMNAEQLMEIHEVGKIRDEITVERDQLLADFERSKAKAKDFEDLWWDHQQAIDMAVSVLGSNPKLLGVADLANERMAELRQVTAERDTMITEWKEIGIELSMLYCKHRSTF